MILGAVSKTVLKHFRWPKLTMLYSLSESKSCSRITIQITENGFQKWSCDKILNKIDIYYFEIFSNIFFYKKIISFKEDTVYIWNAYFVLNFNANSFQKTVFSYLYNINPRTAFRFG